MKLDPLKDLISSVELIDCLGDDLTVVNAARVSMAKESEWDSYGPWDKERWVGKYLSKRDCGLISYLAKHNHWTPFSHPQIQLRIKMPIFVARQWFKHIIGFTRNEVSRRYVDDTPEFFIPEGYRARAENVKQGSAEHHVPFNYRTVVEGPDGVVYVSDEFWNSGAVKEVSRYCGRLYLDMLAQGVCPEQARMVLPQSMYTEFIETGSLAAYARLAKLRLDPHAQKEVRMYAEAVDKIISPLFPVSWAELKGTA